jgi:peptidoglycan/LPS O-acetylase OafA/YrhL
VTTNTQLSTRPRYDVLDGLRGVAALLIVVYHILEIHGLDKFDLIIGHGQLAVDFFFVLSGFVIGYAYDGRWQQMSFTEFLKRRIIRLHPMVVLGMVLGAILFYFGASEVFPLIAQTPLWKVLLYLLLGILMIPVPPCGDIRGWREMYTLDAPAWSLFYEYIANILYGLFIRKFSTKALATLVIAAACANIVLSVFVQGDVIGGWEFSSTHLRAGFIRVMYPFFAGLLLYRLKKLTHIKNGFLWCSLALLALLVVPRLGGKEHLWINGIYESVVILAAFPLIVFLGASSKVKNRHALRFCRWLGAMSYPLYLVNYPVVYVYTAWIVRSGTSLRDAAWQSAAVFAAIVLLSYIVLRCYDNPLQQWLKRRFLPNRS